MNKLSFERRSVLSADEANWFLDLKGFSRARRTHRLVEVDDELIAYYEAYDLRTAALGTAEFQIVDPDELLRFDFDSFDGKTSQPALDAGELLFLAQAFANQVVDEGNLQSLGLQRTLLADAIACVDAVLQRIPTGMDSVPTRTIVSDEGKSILTQEPGRFRRDRLAAYRGGLEKQLSKLDGMMNVVSPDQAAPSAKPLAESVIAAGASIEIIRAQVMPLLEAFGRDASTELLAELKPRDDDFAMVFVAETAEFARLRYGQLWSQPMHIPQPTSLQTVIDCAIAPAGMLDHYNELSRDFPGGYTKIAAQLNPHRVWVAWKYTARGSQSGISFDGLVWIDDHWAWFPKPYRVLRESNC